MNLAAGAVGVALLASIGGYAWYQHRGGRPRVPGPRRAPITEASARAALTADAGNVKRAAVRMGIAEKSLHALLRRYPTLREYALSLRLQHSRTGYGRPPYKSAFGRVLPP